MKHFILLLCRFVVYFLFRITYILAKNKTRVDAYVKNIKAIFLKILFEIINITRANIEIIEIFYHNYFDIPHEYLSLFLFHSFLFLLFFIHLLLFPYFFLFFSIFLFFPWFFLSDFQFTHAVIRSSIKYESNWWHENWE